MTTPVPALCVYSQLIMRLALNGFDLGGAPFNAIQCPEEPTDRVRLDYAEFGIAVWVIGEVCAGHVPYTELAGMRPIGEIPRHVSASP